MHIPKHLVRREEGSSHTSPILIGITAAVGTFFISVAVYVWWYKRRPPSYKTPSDQPSTTSRWSPINLVHLGRRNRTRNSSRLPSDEDTSYTATRSTTNNTQMTTTITTTTNTASNPDSRSVNRNAPGNRGSVRSILTLPPYQPAPAQDERLIAREGERAGVDTVVEFPETADEEEARREEDMDSLFRIRQLRRAEIDARNERRRLRAQAREQGDWARLEQLRLDAQRSARARADSGASAGSNGSGGEGRGDNNNHGSSTTTLALPGSSREAIAEHHARTNSRERRISSVSYADLGLARHDGSRLRADSVDSDHLPLLGSAASIAGSTTTTIPGANRARGDSGASGRNESHPRRTSRFHLPVFSPRHGRQHNRAASAESVVSSNVSDDGSNTALELTPTTSSTDRRDNSNPHPVPFIVTPESTTGSNSNSNDTPGSGSNDTHDSPDQPPPDYDSPPDYTSPTMDNTEGGGPPRLPSVRVQTGEIELPEIQVVESTPIP